MENYKAIINKPNEPFKSLTEISGLFRTVSTVPTHIPRKFDEQFVVYKSGNESRLYWYDPVNAQWNYSSPQWDFEAQLSSDFTVTNNSTLQDVTGFSIPVSNGESWYVEIRGDTSASDTTGDIKGDLMTTGTWITGSSYREGLYFGSTGTLTNVVRAAPSSTTQALGATTVINNGDGVRRAFLLLAHLVIDADGDIKFQIANNSASSGRTSTLHQGAIMRAKKINTT